MLGQLFKKFLVFQNHVSILQELSLLFLFAIISRVCLRLVYFVFTCDWNILLTLRSQKYSCYATFIEVFLSVFPPLFRSHIVPVSGLQCLSYLEMYYFYLFLSRLLFSYSSYAYITTDSIVRHFVHTYRLCLRKSSHVK